jgi:iron complex outermembrane receptor protein
MVRSALTLPENVELDALVRYVGTLPEPHVPSYVAVDARLGWSPDGRAEISVRGQNLLDDEHAEWGTREDPNGNLLRPEFERAVFAEVKLRI